MERLRINTPILKALLGNNLTRNAWVGMETFDKEIWFEGEVLLWFDLIGPIAIV